MSGETQKDAVLVRIDQMDKGIHKRLDRIEVQVKSNSDDLNQAKGGLKLGKWIVGVAISVGGLLGLSTFFKH
jgi:tetrahydromethanopterin S-methyltransferase subunit G